MAIHRFPQDAAVKRRSSFKAAVGIGVAALMVGLAGCSGSSATSPEDEGGEVSAEVLPSYIPVEYIAPDLPGANGSTPGFTAWPSEIAQSSSKPPGTGLTITAMTPIWGVVPEPGNQYFQAVNEVLGTDVQFLIQDGNTYAEKLATVLASPKDVPDWVSLQNWMAPAGWGDEILPNVFTDLTPYLSGDNVKKWPNLANIPTDAWRSAVWNDKLYGLPLPAAPVQAAIYYRDDLIGDQGSVATAEDLFALGKEITDPAKKIWAFDNPWPIAESVFGVVPQWDVDADGKLLIKYETEAYIDALEWAASLVEEGLVHPDAVGGWGQDRFRAGETLIMADSAGGWEAGLGAMLGDNPTYSQKPFAGLSADGDTEPVIWKQAGATQYSFIKQSDDPKKVEEILNIANVIAAPFGTEEYNLIRWGIEGTHYTLENGSPKPTDVGAAERRPTYSFLVAAPPAQTQFQFPGFVEAYVAWMADATQYVKEPLFYGQNIDEPIELASLYTIFEDLQADVISGRKGIEAIDQGLEQWKKDGGEDLRAFYQDILDAE